MNGFDLVIRGGTIVDGTGAAGFVADLAVATGRITAIGSLPPGVPTAQEVDAGGMMVAPGFIDIHTHADIALLNNPEHLPKVMQGVTTEVFTNCGLGFAPITDESLPILRQYLGGLFGPTERVDWKWRSVAGFLARFEEQGIASNAAYLVSHGAIRTAVMGMEGREATAAELDEMVALVEQAMDEGAWGLSTGLWYAPMRYAGRQEIVALCKKAGIFATHQRDYEEFFFPATQETIEIADEAGVPVQLSHLQFNGPINWGRGAEMLSLLDAARDRGVDITWDSYPYLAGSTMIQAMLPEWANAGGPEALLQRLKEPESREAILLALTTIGRSWDRMVLSGAHTAGNLRFEGETFERIAAARSLTVPELICSLLEEEGLKACYVYHNAHEPDLRAAMQHPAQMIGSDGLHLAGKCHPRLYGTFPRVLGHYVREEKVLSLEEAVRKMSSAPAQRLGLKGRGVLAVGNRADITIFDPAEVADTATYAEPLQFPRGIPYVFVNGAAVKWQDQPTQALPGQVLRRSN